MNDKARAKEKIRMYNDCIQHLKDEQTALEKLLLNNQLDELNEARAKQRLFDIKVTIGGHEAFIREYQERLNPTTYRKSL
jgi:hypothetical protein